MEEIRELAAPLEGARIAQINSTTYGGGVCELLRSIVPLYRGLGIQGDWRIISAGPSSLTSPRPSAMPSRVHRTS